MNYSALLPVLQIVLITVLAMIEAAPARTGDKPVDQTAQICRAARIVLLADGGREGGRAPVLGSLASARAHGEHGYSSKLHLNSE